MAPSQAANARLVVSILSWIGVIEYVFWELFLAIFSFLAVADRAYFSPSTVRTIYVLGLFINGTLWLLVFFGANRLGLSKASMRRQPMAFATQSGSLYFLRTFVGHVLLTLLIVVYMDKFGELDVLSFTTNLGAFLVFRTIHLVNLIHFLFVSYGILTDMRYNGFVSAFGSQGRGGGGGSSATGGN